MRKDRSVRLLNVLIHLFLHTRDQSNEGDNGCDGKGVNIVYVSGGCTSGMGTRRSGSGIAAAIVTI